MLTTMLHSRIVVNTTVDTMLHCKNSR